MTIRPLLLALGALLPAAAHADGELFQVRDQNPLIRGAYLPLPGQDGGQGFSAVAGVQWTNTVNIENTPAESLRVDEESVELDLTLAYADGPWRARATLPVIDQGPGILDGVVDDWHRLWGLPRGDRPARPRYAYAIDYANSAGVAVDVPRGSSLGDLALEAGRVLRDDGGRRLTLWAGLEAPTGARSRLAGDGALDAALWLEGSRRLSARFTLAGRAGLTRQGGSGPLPMNDYVAFGTLGLEWHATERFGAQVQFDAHGAAARDSSLMFLGRAVLMSFGGRYRLASGSVLEAAVVEDIEVDHSPDVSFHVGWRWPIGAGRR